MTQEASPDQTAAIGRLLMIAQGTHALLRAIAAGDALTPEQAERSRHQILAWGHASSAYDRACGRGSAAGVNGLSPAAGRAAAAALPPPAPVSRPETQRKGRTTVAEIQARQQRIVAFLTSAGEPQTLKAIANHLQLDPSVVRDTLCCSLFKKIPGAGSIGNRYHLAAATSPNHRGPNASPQPQSR